MRNKLDVALRLGRVSNLPTTWSNMLAGLVLAGAPLSATRTLLLCVAASLFYTGGMYLNDAFDREIDARERPERPIPSGQGSAATVFAAGFAMLGLGLLLSGVLAFTSVGGAPAAGWPVLAAGAALACVILLYDLHHKNNPLSPLLMATCRVLLYVLAAVSTAAAHLGLAFAWGCVALLGYLIGLTYVAKQENLRELKGVWPLVCLALPFTYLPALAHPAGVACYVLLLGWVLFTLSFLWSPARRNIPRAVTQFIAGISLLDALLIAGQGLVAPVVPCLLAFGLTRLFQRVVPGT